MNKFNFWDNSKGIFEILSQGEFLDLVENAINSYKNEAGVIFNFNPKKTVFYVRTDVFCVRIAQNWGQIEKCLWDLDRDCDPEKYQMAIIHYLTLKSN